jgi:hypothetical protein
VRAFASLLLAVLLSAGCAMAAVPRALSFFADEEDARVLLAWLNADPEIAVIVADGPRTPKILFLFGYRPPQRWRAVRGLNSLKDGEHSLWYVPAGPLTMLKADPNAADVPIPDPWAGWTEERLGADPDKPYFGPSHRAVIRLTLWTRHRPYTQTEMETLDETISYWTEGHDVIVESHLQWGGGNAKVEDWWRRLEAFMKRSATPLAAHLEPSEVVWAFPSALKKLKAGMRYEARGWDLDRSIRRAALPAPRPAK